MRTQNYAAALVLAALASGCSPARTETPVDQAAPVTASFGQVETTDVPLVFEAGGIVRARSTAVIASRMLAPVLEVRVRPGDQVRRGDTLIALDAREMSANSARAASSVAALSEAASAAEADARAAEAGLQLARATSDRISGLHAKRSATPQELDQALAGLHAAEAQVAGANARTASARAARDAAQSAADAATVTSSYALITAPFDGRVTERSVDPGAMATPGAPLLTIEDTSAFRLEVQLDEARAAFGRVGQNVDVGLDHTAPAGAGWSAGRIAEVGRLEPASHTFLLKIDLPASPAVQSGQFGRARFAGPARQTLTMPASALLRRGQMTFVYAVDESGHARLRPVTAGQAVNERVEVLAGAKAGDRLVTNPPPGLSDGALVHGDGR